MPVRPLPSRLFLVTFAASLAGSARAEPESQTGPGASLAAQAASTAVSEALAPAAPAAPPAPEAAAPVPGAPAAQDAKEGAKRPEPPTPFAAQEELPSLLKLGGAMAERGDFQAAEIAYGQVLKSPAAKPAELRLALLGLARMHRRAGALTKAISVYQRFLKDYPGDALAPDALLELGRSQRDVGANRLAITNFYSVINSTLKLEGNGFEHYQLLAKTAQFEIAETHFLSGDYAEAAKFFTRLRLLDLAPADRARAHFKAAYSLSLLGESEAAVASLRDYLEKWPDDENVPEARYLIATSLRTLKRPQEAFAAALALLQTEKARLQKDPKRWAYWQRRTGNQLANDFFEAGDIHNAELIYAGLAALTPDPVWRLPVIYQIALCRERMGDVEVARASYQEVIDAPAAKSSPELGELARMATWRIANLDWRETASRQIQAIAAPGPESGPTAAPAPHGTATVATSVP